MEAVLIILSIIMEILLFRLADVCSQVDDAENIIKKLRNK